jgi:hypothetical protein
VSLGGVCTQLSIRLEFPCTNNQAEYEAILCGLEWVKGIGKRDISEFRDSRLIVQQIRGEGQCLDGVLNEYRERCLEIISTLDTFCITHIPRERNERANELAQQPSEYEVSKGMFLIKPGPMSWCMPDLENESVGGDGVYRQEEKVDGMIQTNDVCQGNDGKSGRGEEKRSDVPGGTSTCESNAGREGKEEDWRQCIKMCIKNPSKDRKVRRQALKYTMIDDKLYQHTMEGMLLKCLNTEQARITMGEVHEGLCGAHQSANKMKWTFRRAGLYWLAMVDDYIRYKRGCEAC